MDVDPLLWRWSPTGEKLLMCLDPSQEVRSRVPKLSLSCGGWFDLEIHLSITVATKQLMIDEFRSSRPGRKRCKGQTDVDSPWARSMGYITSSDLCDLLSGCVSTFNQLNLNFLCASTLMLTLTTFSPHLSLWCLNDITKHLV
jgi:hypothetical protein